MALTQAELARIEAIEGQINKIQIAIKNLASQMMVRSALLLKQKEIDALTARVSTLESQVSNLLSSV